MNSITLGDFRKALEKYPDDMSLWLAVCSVSTRTSNKFPYETLSMSVAGHHILGTDLTERPASSYKTVITNVRLYDLARAFLNGVNEANKKYKK